MVIAEIAAKLPGMGISRFRQLERILFPGKFYTPPRVHPAIPQSEGSFFNGNLSLGTVKTLARGGITTVEQLREATRTDLLAIKALGATKLREIERAFKLRVE